MESVIRGLVVFFFLLLVFRISGKRTLAEASTFDLVLLLIISETTQQAMVDGDHSMTNAAILILTLTGASVALSLIKQWSPLADRWVDGVPLVVVADGILLHDRMNKERIDENDILEAARELQGIEALSEIKYAVLERSGSITVIPRKKADAGAAST